MNSLFPVLSAEQLVRKLEAPSGNVRMVLDTDTFNEIDDQKFVAQAGMPALNELI